MSKKTDSSQKQTDKEPLPETIADLKKALEALRESEDRYRDLVENSQDLICTHDLEGRILSLNPWASKVLGYDMDTILQMNIRDVLAAEVREGFDAYIAKIRKRGAATGLLIVQTAAGERRVWEYNNTLRTEGVAVPMVRGMARDITERKRTEEKLRESEERFRKIFEESPFGMVLTSRNLQFFSANPAFCQMLGYTAEEMNRKTFLDVTHPDHREADKANVEKMWQGEIPHYRTEKRYITKNGDIRWGSLSASIIQRQEGEPLYALAMVEDITERKQAENAVKTHSEKLEEMVEERTHELHEAQERLIRQEKLAVLGQLAGGVGHELRNPLAVINNAVYYLKLVQPEASEKVKEYLGMIERETHTAEKIITDLLDFARIKSVDREAVAVPELVQRVLARFPAPPSVKVKFKLPTDLPPVFADPRQMEQVLGNLFVNAFQAMPQGGVLTISATKKGAEIAIAIADTGVGILPENMQKLFEPLFTTKQKGIGLGLAVSKKLVEANSGRIEVRSKPGKGTTFTVNLPLEQGFQP